MPITKPTSRRPRLLACTGLAIAFALAAFASTASATTVYDYVYSGSYFDGSGAGHPFDERIGGVEYDRADHLFYVGDGNQAGEFGTLGSITKITPAGAGVNFPATGTPQILSTRRPDFAEFEITWPFVNPNVVVDQTGGPHDGNIYATGTERLYAWDPEGNLLFEKELSETGVGVTVLADGNLLVNGPARGKTTLYNYKGDRLREEYNPGSPGLKPSVNAKWSEFGNIQRTVADNDNNVYGIAISAPDGDGYLVKDTAEAKEFYELNHPGEAAGPTTGIAVDHSDNNVFALRSNNTFESFDSEGRLLGKGWGTSDEGHSYAGLAGEPIGIAVDPETHDVWIANRRSYSGVRRVEAFEAVNPHVIPDSTAVAPDYSDPTGNTIVLQGKVNPDGQETTDCHFEYGTKQSELNKTLPCTQGNKIAGSADVAVTSVRIPVKHGIRYWYKLSTKNAGGQVAPSNTENFIPQGKPIVSGTVVDRISTDGARLKTELDPNGGNASVHFEYGVKGGPLDQRTPETDTVGFNSENENFGSTSQYQPGIYPKANLITGLSADTTYEYLAVVTNEAGTVSSQAGEFRTYRADAGTDPCPNASVRKQTGSALLLDCRGYELASAANAGGFDVESDLVPGLEPLLAYPSARDSLLYSMHFGVIPGVAGSPTNLGRDPYVAHRGANGWTTEYVGLPADGMADGGAFGSPLLGADTNLEEFAFGGTDICVPCFGDGTTNIPLRRSNGELTEGISGSLGSAADRSGSVARPFSADGVHFVFGTSTQVEPGGSTQGSIYDRNLATNTTQVVSTLPGGGGAIQGGGVGELDISSNGSRIVVGKRISTDAKGNEYWHLYMHVGNTADSIDLTPGATLGALFDGMSADGSRVFFTTRDKLVGEDTDSMADIYEAAIGGSSAAIRLVSVKDGAPSNDEACTPPGTPESWNSVSGNGKCDVVAFAGGSGTAADGTFYFVSPELLDGGQGEAGQVNLYAVKPGGEPTFVATSDSNVGKASPAPPKHPVAAPKRVTGLANPEAIAIDRSGGSHTGDLYVYERGSGDVARYTAAGAADNFSALPGPSNKLAGLSGTEQGRVQVAVDSAAASPFKEDVYATDGSGVSVFAASGEKLGSIGGFTEPCGVAVEQSTGDVYVAEPSTGTIWRLAPVAATKPVTAANYVKTGLKPEEGSAGCQLAVDNDGRVYVSEFSEGPVKRYDASDFQAVPGEEAGTVIAANGNAIATDSSTNDLLIDTGLEVLSYDEAGSLIQKFGTGSLSGSRGIAVDPATKHVFASSGANVVDFGVEEVPYHPIDQPGVVDGVLHSGLHSFEGFQTTPDGRYAVFSTKHPVTGYPVLGHSEVYRYDSQGEEILCVSCSPTGGAASADTSLSRTGLNLADDGRVFFTTAESLALRDTNEKSDAYEWELPGAAPAIGGCQGANGCVQLISGGIGPENSGLVSVSADGKDVFFFTRDVLAHEDENGNAIKIYDAREGGGFLYDPPRKACAASDECHGAGSETPPAPVINTITGSKAGARTVKGCKHGYVKKNGKCVKKKTKKKNHRKHHKKTGHGHA